MTRPIHPLVVDASAMAYVAQAAFPTCKATFNQAYSTGVAPLDTTAIAGCISLLQARTKAVQGILIQEAAELHGVDRADILNNPEGYDVAKVMPVLVYDHTAPTFRHIKEPAYKAQRDSSDQGKPTLDENGDEIAPVRELVRTQLAKLSEFADLLGIPQLYSVNAEADDTAYQMTRLFRAKGVASTMLTVDTDWMLGVAPGVAWHSLTNKIPKQVKEEGRNAAFRQAVEGLFDLYHDVDSAFVSACAASEKALAAATGASLTNSMLLLNVVNHIRNQAHSGDPAASRLLALAQEEGMVTTSGKIYVDYVRAHYLTNNLPEYNQPELGWIQGHHHVTPTSFEAMTGYPNPEKQVLSKILMGDSADNLTGVKGIGEEKARYFVEKYSSASEFYLKCMAEPEFEAALRNPKLKSVDTAVERLLLTENGYRMFAHSQQLIDLGQAPIIENLIVHVRDPDFNVASNVGNIQTSVLLLGIAPTVLNLNKELLPDQRVLNNPEVLAKKVLHWSEQAVDLELSSALAGNRELSQLLFECQEDLAQLRDANPEFGAEYEYAPLELIPTVVPIKAAAKPQKNKNKSAP